jgi:hypothetical protein
MNTYFAEDGAYGNATGLVIIDTENWTTEDWDLMDDTQDWDRPRVARDIALTKITEDN